MNPSAASVYFVLGTPGSGRRVIVQDLVENGLAPTDEVLLLVAGGEETNDAETALAKRENVEVRRWSWDGTNLPPLELTPGSTVFLLADAGGDPINQLESLKPWLVQQGAELARVICVVDCQLAEKTPQLQPWFDALIHFADVVFLTNREGVENKWLSGFIRRYEEQFYPCHFLHFKKTGIANPALVLEPEPRRVSHYFDEQEDLSGVEIETDDDEEEVDEDDDLPKPEPYFERNRSGRRVKELPDLRAFLPQRR